MESNLEPKEPTSRESGSLMLAVCQVFPPSVLTSTFDIPLSPAKARPAIGLLLPTVAALVDNSSNLFRSASPGRQSLNAFDIWHYLPNLFSAKIPHRPYRQVRCQLSTLRSSFHTIPEQLLLLEIRALRVMERHSFRTQDGSIH